MRILHTSDWHLGHSLKGFDRHFERQCFLDRLIPAGQSVSMLATKPAVLIAFAVLFTAAQQEQSCR